MNVDASVPMSMVATRDVCERVQPNSFSMAGTKTLHA